MPLRRGCPLPDFEEILADLTLHGEAVEAALRVLHVLAAFVQAFSGLNTGVALPVSLFGYRSRMLFCQRVDARVVGP